MKYTIAVDFDGVLHRYDTPWKAPHIIPDLPVYGAIDWLHEQIQHFDVVIFTTRARTWRGRRAVRQWLRRFAGIIYYDGMGYRGIEEVKITAHKPPALVYIDDRAWRFEGKFPSVDEIHKVRPWHKR